MAEAKGIISKLEDCIKIVHILGEHNKKLVNEVATLSPSHNAVKAQLLKAGFGSESSNEDNMKLLVDHQTNLVAENTRLHKTITDRDALMEQLREVVLKSAD